MEWAECVSLLRVVLHVFLRNWEDLNPELASWQNLLARQLHKRR